MLNKGLLDRADKAVKDFHELIDLGLINKRGEFVPTLMYLPMTQHPPITEEEFLKGYKLPADNRFCVYLHVPFCIVQCAFCHFPNVIGATEGDKDAYFSYMEKEMDLYLKKLGVSRIKARSMLLGGGTPTNVSPAQLKRLLKAMTAHVDTDELTQFSCDLDPLTMLGWEGKERMRMLRDAGVSRLALGVQSFSDDMLKRMGRHHNAADTIRAIGVAKEMGFDLNRELIYGYPGETPEHWVEMVKQAMGLAVDEIMIYRLKILPYGAKPGAITSLFDSRGNPLISNDEQIRLKSVAMELLESNGYHETITRFFSRKQEGYSQYSSNFMGDQYDNIGFGLYAMSMFRDRFKQNTLDMKEYFSELDAGRLPLKTGIVRTRDQQLRRNVVMPLKNRHVSKKAFREITGAEVGEVFAKKIALLKSYGLLQEDAEFLKPTAKGRFFVDEITQFFFHPDYMPFGRDKFNEGPLNPFVDNELMA
jgi:oxygen-independent coproporphyrinogen-3 oxidase